MVARGVKDTALASLVPAGPYQGLFKVCKNTIALIHIFVITIAKDTAKIPKMIASMRAIVSFTVLNR